MTEERLEFSSALAAIQDRLADQDIKFFEEVANSDRDLLEADNPRRDKLILDDIFEKTKFYPFNISY